MRVLDLFSGIGGFSLGLERAGMTTVAFCEIEPYCRRVLAKHWPGVPIHGDIRKLVGIPCDVITGGFPCQPFSSASRGRKLGSSDDRFLWPEMLRVINDSGPSWVIAENVAQFNGVAFAEMVSDLEGSGYEVETLEIPACAVGCDHWRARLWILGYSDRHGKPGKSVNAEMAVLPGSGLDPGSARAAHGLSGRLDGHRRAAIGNAVVPQIPEIIGRAIMGLS